MKETDTSDDKGIMPTVRLLKILSGFLVGTFSILSFGQFVPVGIYNLKPPSGLTYAASYNLGRWETITPITPTMDNYDGRVTLTFSIVPALPSGLTMNTSTGVISGASQVYDLTGTLYTITASNAAGSTQTTTTISVTAPNYTWSGNAFPDTNWTTGGNWVGGTPPTNAQPALFDNYCSTLGGGCNATINANIDINDLLMKSDYTGTITQSGAVTINLGDDSRANPYGLVMEAGTFVGGSGNITMDVFQLTGGSFTATSGTMRIGYDAQQGMTEGSWIRSGATFAHNNGTIIFDPTGNNTAYAKTHQFEADQQWNVYNLEFDIDSSTTLSDGEVSGHYIEILGTNGIIAVANNLDFRDGFGYYGRIEFSGSDVYFHCDAPTYDKCSDAPRDLSGPGFAGVTELHFVGSSAQTYSYDAGADSWLEFVSYNSNGVSTLSTGDFSIPGLRVEAGNFTAPSGSNFYFFNDTDYGSNSNAGGFEINGTGTYTHNSSTLIVNPVTNSNGNLAAVTFTDDVTLHNLTVNVVGDNNNTAVGDEYTGVDLGSGVDLTIVNDMRVQNGRIEGAGAASSTITVQGDFFRECSSLAPNHRCADSDVGLTYIFDTAGSNITVSDGADEFSFGSDVDLTINPGAGNTVTVNGILTSLGGTNDLTVSSGTLNLASGADVLIDANLVNNAAITCAANAYVQYYGSLSGTPGGGNNPGCYTNTPPDDSFPPGWIDWVDFTGTSTLETFSSIDVAIVVNVSYVNTTGTPVVEARTGFGQWQTLTAATPMSFDIIPSAGLQFRVSGTSGHQATITVINVPDNNKTLDTIIATAP